MWRSEWLLFRLRERIGSMQSLLRNILRRILSTVLGHIHGAMPLWKCQVCLWLPKRRNKICRLRGRMELSCHQPILTRIGASKVSNNSLWVRASPSNQYEIWRYSECGAFETSRSRSTTSFKPTNACLSPQSTCQSLMRVSSWWVCFSLAREQWCLSRPLMRTWCYGARQTVGQCDGMFRCCLWSFWHFTLGWWL